MNKGWKYCRVDISPTVEKMTETKCKMEEDHRIFAERPCSYGYLFWCTGIHKQTYQLLVFLVLNQRYLQIYVLVSRLPVWLLESCDLERGEKEIAIFLSSRKSEEILQYFSRKRLQYFYLRPTLTFILTSLTAPLQLQRAKLQRTVQTFLALLTLPKVATNLVAWKGKEVFFHCQALFNCRVVLISTSGCWGQRRSFP